MTTHAAQLPAPLAEDADTARRHAGPCHLCQRAILSGMRYARLVPGGQHAHSWCIARAARTTAMKPARPR